MYLYQNNHDRTFIIYNTRQDGFEAYMGLCCTVDTKDEAWDYINMQHDLFNSPKTLYVGD